MFANRLEVQSPGGLFGNVAIDNLEDEHSTRNARLMRMMEDMHVVENRGSGIGTMLHAMREANLEPPRFHDRRTSFTITLNNHTLMTPEAIQWLNRFAHLPLNDHQRLALVYLKQNHDIDNQDYRRLNRVDMVTAGQDLRGLIQADLVEQTGVGRWTKYGLKVSEGEPSESPIGENEKKIIAHIQQHGSITNAECREILGSNLTDTSYLLKKMTEKGLIKRVGKRRWTRYEMP